MNSNDEAPVARVDDLFFAYPQRPLFRGWNARFPAGMSFVQGDDGSGKTTLLRLIAGDLMADGGRLEIAGCRLDQDAGRYRAQVFRTDPRAEMPQQMSPLIWLESLRARYRDFDQGALSALIGQLQLLEHRDKPMFMLSTGARRKVWLVAALVCGTPLTLIDQPFAALDKASIVQVQGLLRAASTLPGRAWVVADYEPPAGQLLVQTITIG